LGYTNWGWNLTNAWRTLQKELVEREKMAALGSVVAGVAHEVNTRLGVSISSNSLIEDRTRALRRAWEGDRVTEQMLDGFLEDVAEASDIVARNLDRAAGLVRSFKQISVDLNTEEAREVGVREYLEEIVGTFRNGLKKKCIRVELDCPEDLVRRLQAGPFAQIVTNLLQNVLLHAFRSEQEGHVRIRVTALSNALLLELSDDGEGMTPEVRARVFEPFFTTSRERGGSGLGLHIVFNIVTHQFGGRIELESAPGQGTRFFIHLPCGEGAK
jgi:two-component system NtrC family sensor kinase